MKLKFAEAISVPESERRPVADSINYRSIGISVVAFPLYSAYCIWGFIYLFIFYVVGISLFKIFQMFIFLFFVIVEKFIRVASICF